MDKKGAFIVGRSPTRLLLILLLALLVSAFLAQAVTAGTTQIGQFLGIFRDSGQDLGENGGNAVAVGDLDGDNDLDAVLNGQVWINDGQGMFTRKNQVEELGADKMEIALADVDGDLDLDLIAAMSGPNKIWLNDGSATFADSGQILGGGTSWSLAVGDVDNDDDIDILFGTDGSSNLYLNNGSGKFTVSPPALSGHVRAVALEDVDGDLDLDAFFADCTTYLNDGNGLFTFKDGSQCSPADSVTMDMGDIDDDDDIDAVIGNATKNANIVMLNDGDGNFSDSGQSLGSSSTEQVILGDIDLDGDLDFYSGNTTEQGGDPADRAWLNDGLGKFSDSGQELGETVSFGAAFADVDGDGDPDVFVGSPGAPNSLYLNGVEVYYLPIIVGG